MPIQLTRAGLFGLPPPPDPLGTAAHYAGLDPGLGPTHNEGDGDHNAAPLFKKSTLF